MSVFKVLKLRTDILYYFAKNFLLYLREIGSAC